DIKYDGIVILKSTLLPDVVNDLYLRYGRSKTLNKEGPLRYVYSPEFLREAHWEQDAIDPKQIILAGDFHDCNEIQEIYKNHSHVKYIRFQFCDYAEAALVKYTINTFLASKVVFMNQIYQLCADTYGHTPSQEGWKFFTSMLRSDMRFGDSHYDVPGEDGQYGYGGSCLPKDMKAFLAYDKNKRLTILQEAELANTKIRLTGDSNTE
ncbi:MAG TPA: hypothetical protein VIY47_00780, partial [Ignavibacteriaceae bacterium]